MKTRTIYTCSICQEDYDTEEEALSCEAQGRAIDIPRGVVWQYLWKDRLIVFVSDRVSATDRHVAHVAVAVFRDNGAGDNWIDGGGGGSDGGYLRAEDLCNEERYPFPPVNAPATLRALQWCDERNIVPMMITKDGLRHVARASAAITKATQT